jgi:long-chain fatty acid transport protein
LNRLCRSTSIVLAGLSASGPALAEGPRDAHLAGARSSALAGAGTASAEDCSASYYNPANLARGTRSWVCVDYSVSGASLEPGGRSEADHTVHTLGAGLVSRGTLLGVPFGVGALLSLPNGKLSRIEGIATVDESWVLDTNRPQVSFGALGFGIEPVPRLSFGAALHVLAGVRGDFGVGGRLARPNEYDSELRHDVDADLASARSFGLGAAVRVTDHTRLALAYRHRARIDQKIAGDLAGDVGEPPSAIPARYEVESIVTPADYPSALSFGTAHELGRLSVLAEIAWENFSEWRPPDGRSTTRLTLGGFPIDPGYRPQPLADLELRDRFVPRLGFEYRLLAGPPRELRLRAGYAFERSPLPEQFGTPRWLDSDRHLFTAGAGFETSFGDHALRVDLFGRLAVLAERTAVSESSLGPALKASGKRYGAGVTSSFGF